MALIGPGEIGDLYLDMAELDLSGFGEEVET